ncbi:hypothetical protein KIPB_007661 [Kipferlia bialata]|uniref:Uncharacterized protein n=1 Tax=Kipferlia bialata TaxID=797122 RepID=A0A9K3D0M5_9EUKA|nr:hypothetical protein KIPB_007661 [Kipferlia bialata]|eukprot:g7661.t1
MMKGLEHSEICPMTTGALVAARGYRGTVDGDALRGHALLAMLGPHTTLWYKDRSFKVANHPEGCDRTDPAKGEVECVNLTGHLGRTGLDKVIQTVGGVVYLPLTDHPRQHYGRNRYSRFYHSEDATGSRLHTLFLDTLECRPLSEPPLQNGMDSLVSLSFVLEGDIYYIGCWKNHSEVSYKCWCYNPERDTWRNTDLNLKCRRHIGFGEASHVCVAGSAAYLLGSRGLIGTYTTNTGWCILPQGTAFLGGVGRSEHCTGAVCVEERYIVRMRESDYRRSGSFFDVYDTVSGEETQWLGPISTATHLGQSGHTYLTWGEVVNYGPSPADKLMRWEFDPRGLFE